MSAPELFLEIGVGANDFVIMPTPLVGVDSRPGEIDFEKEHFYLGVDMPLVPERSWRDIHAWFIGSDFDYDQDAVQSIDSIVKEMNDAKDIVSSYRPNALAAFAIADCQALPLRSESVSEVYMSNVLGSQINDDAIEAMLLEVNRVLKSTGRLVIRENITPQWVPEDLDKMLIESGFYSPMNKYGFSDQTHKDLVKRYGASWQDTGHDNIDENKKREIEDSQFFALVEKK